MIDIASVVLNPDIPDSMFTVEFPENAKVVDYSQGGAQELNPARAVPLFSRDDRSWLPPLAAIALAVALSGTCYWYARRHATPRADDKPGP